MSALRRGLSAGEKIEVLEPRRLLSAYYVAASGGLDSNPGTLAKPFATIQQAANLAVAGDTVYIRAGKYRETVHPAHSGTAAAPITFTSYNNEVVTIDGADPITGWGGYSGSIYTASMPWTLGDGNDQVFVDNNMLTEARFPNTGLDPLHPVLAKADAVSATVNPDPHGLSTATIKYSGLTDLDGTWVGATIHIAPGQQWVFQTGTVIAYTKGVITYQYRQLTSYEVPAAGNPFYLTGKFQGLNSASEWYHDPTTNKLYLWTLNSDNPTNHVVEAKHRPFGVDLSGNSYVKLNNLHLFACTINTDDSSNHNSISALNAAFVSHTMDNAVPWDRKFQPAISGIILNGTYNVIDGSNIAYSSGDGVFLGGSNNIVSNSTIHEVDYAAGDEAGVSVRGAGNQVLHNLIYNTARSGVQFDFATSVKILNNTVHDIGLQTTDSGGIYTWSTDGKGTEIAYNTVYNATGGGYGNTGLFLDDDSTNYVVHHNVVYNADAALKMNPDSPNNQIYNNTLIGNKYSLSAGRNAQMLNSVFANNIMTSAVVWGSGVIRRINLVTTLANVHFVNPAAGDYRLQASSPAVDSGTIVAPYTNGYSGKGPDQGALELATVVTPPTRNARNVIQAESFDSASGVTIQSPGVGGCDNGDWLKFSRVDFGTGITKFMARVAVTAQYAGSRIEVHLDGTTGPIIATLVISSTGSWSVFTTQTAAVKNATGVHDLYLDFKGSFGVCNIDWLQFA